MDHSFLQVNASPVLIFLFRSLANLCLVIEFEQYLTSLEEETAKCLTNPPTLVNLESLGFFVPKVFG